MGQGVVAAVLEEGKVAAAVGPQSGILRVCDYDVFSMLVRCELYEQ